MRVVAGELKSRRLLRPPEGVRPTADRVRESLFARLGDLSDARVLDLYAGTGALAIEALSRGALDAVLVERAPRALAVIRENLELLGLSERSRVLRGDATTWLARLGRADEQFDLVFVDLPYGSNEAGPALVAIVEAAVLADGGVVMIETAKNETLAAVDGLLEDGRWMYGDTAVMRLRAHSRCSRGS